MEITQFLNHFDSVSDERDGYLARCPGHGDGKPSLKIFVGSDGKARLTCRAGCATGDVVRAAGLEWRDLFDISGAVNVVPAGPPPLVGPGQIAALRVWLDSLSAPERAVYEYANQRFGITPEVAHQLGLKEAPVRPAKSFAGVSGGFSSYPRLVVPLTGFDGVVRGAQGRDVSGQCPGRWLSLTNISGTRWAAYGVLGEATPNQPTIITEGPGDGLTVAALGYRAVVVRGAHLAKNEELVNELSASLRASGPVLVAGDRGDAGDAFTARLVASMGALGVDARPLRVSGDDDITAWREGNPDGFPDEFRAAVDAALQRKGETPVAETAVLDSAPVEIDDDEWARIAGTLAKGPDKLIPHVDFAALVRRVVGDVIMHVQGIGWHAWSGTHWEHTASDGAAHQALTTTSQVLQVRAAEDPRSSGWVSEARAVLRNTVHRNHIVSELGRLPETQATADDLDAKRHLLNFRNGTVDLRTGALHPHDPADKLTHVANIDYSPKAKAPRWERFIEEIHPHDPEVRAYFQRYLGMSLSGEVKDHKLGVWYGAHGRNGKGTTVRALQAAFGHGLVHEIPFSVFENVRDGGNPEKVVAQLRGARLVVAQEGSPDAPIKTHLLRNWSGGDRLTGRHLYAMPFTYTPTFTLTLATNHLPQFSSGGEALWARTDALLFGESFAGREDRSMEQTLCGPEREGIAAWVVQGAIEYYADGLRPPTAVVDATAMHREEVDPLRPLVGEVFVYKEGATAVRGEFNAQLRVWRDDNGDRSGSYLPKAVQRCLMRAGVVERRAAGGKWVYEGVALVSDLENERRTGPGIFAKD